MDILPTILDITNITHPAPLFYDYSVAEIKGAPWVTYLCKKSHHVHDEEGVTFWELFAQQAIRKGTYKALFIPKPLCPGNLQLFDLLDDPRETKDSSRENREILNELINRWSEYVAEKCLVGCSNLLYNALRAEY